MMRLTLAVKMKLRIFKWFLNLSKLITLPWKPVYGDMFARNDNWILNIKEELSKIDFFYLWENIDQCNHNVIMVAHFCHCLSDNNVDKSALYVGLSDHYVDLSGKIFTASSSTYCYYLPINATYLSIWYLTSQHYFLTSRHHFLTSRHIIT